MTQVDVYYNPSAGFPIFTLGRVQVQYHNEKV